MKEFLKDDNFIYKCHGRNDDILGKHITTIKINGLEMLLYLLFLPIFVIILGLFEEPFTVLGCAFVFSIIEIYLLIKFFMNFKIEVFQFGIKYKKLSARFDDLKIIKNKNTDYVFISNNIKEKYKPLKISKNNYAILEKIIKLTGTNSQVNF